MKSVAIRKNGTWKLSVSAKVEMIKEPSEPIQWLKAGVEVLDENEVRICEETGFAGFGVVLKGVAHKGDVGTLSTEIETGNLTADQVIKDARFVRLTSAYGYK